MAICSQTESNYANRHAASFLATGGVAALTHVLSMDPPQPTAVRYTLIALDLLTQKYGTEACEALLGWWQPPLATNDRRLNGGNATVLANGRAGSDTGPSNNSFDEVDRLSL